MLWAATDSGFTAWHGPSLLVTNRRGECGAVHPLSGFYFRETRYLRTLELLINGRAPWWCAGGAIAQNRLSLSYVHPELAQGGGGGTGSSTDTVERDQDGLPRRGLELLLDLDVGVGSLTATLTLTNRAREPIAVELEWRFGADFADLQEAERPPDVAVEAADLDHGVELRRAGGAPGMATRIEFDGPSRWTRSPQGFTSHLETQPGQSFQTVVRVFPRDPEGMPDAAGVADRTARLREWRRGVAEAGGGGLSLFPEIVNRAMDDLGSLSLLEGEPDEWLAPAAGIPMYPALFGRDSLTAGWQAASLDRGEMLDSTLCRLGRLQGTVLDPARDEQPGRIIQQTRRGPVARSGRTPFDRYYGDVASPFMFVIALAQLYAWNGDRALLARHWDTARRVLDWAREHGDMDGDGYIEYRTTAPGGPTHQGWKDSGDAMVDATGRPLATPLAAAEVQGYWYAAQQLAAVLSLVQGARNDALDHWGSAQTLKRRFNKDFWLPDQGFPALALDEAKRPVASIGSNAGHCLASGIINRDRVPMVAGRLFAPDLFSGWGIRTLSARHPAYDPVSYHRGSVWAVENATIAFGLRRYGLNDRALDLTRALTDLAALYPGYRIPECVGGYDRWEHPHPGAYPRATSLQAWNQSGFPLLLQTILGLQPLAPLGVLIVDPVLPSWIPEITVRRLRVGRATVGLRFTRRRNGATRVRVTYRRGPLRVLRQPPPESLTARAADRWGGLVSTVRLQWGGRARRIA
jgi:glycogen debranching enzyme